jgi:hypothetical protein
MTAPIVRALLASISIHMPNLPNSQYAVFQEITGYPENNR